MIPGVSGEEATNDTIIYFLGPQLSKGAKTQTRRHQTFNTFDYSGTVSVDVRPELNLETSLGIQYYTRHIEYILAAGEQFAAPGLSTVSATAANPRASDSYLDDKTLGVYVQEQLGWQGRLFLTGALRVDNNSAFGADFDFVTYPKASLSWVLNEEPWWSERAPGWLRTFKLRAAYGQSGQQPIAFAALRTYTPVTGPGNTPAVTTGALGNPSLGPERGTELEVGFDAGLFEDRLGVDFTFYNSRTKDAILLRPLAPSTGYSGSQWVNIGEVGNRGIELLVNARVVSRPNLAWDLTLNLSTNHNETLDLGGEPFVAATGRTRSVVGYPVAAFWLQKIVSAERDASSAITNIMCAGGPENNNQPVPCFDAARRLVAPFVYLGPVNPTREGSVTSSVRLLERVRFTTLVDFKYGLKRFNNNHRARCSVFRVCRENVFPEAYDARYIAAIQNGVSIQGEFVEDASFAKLREVSLTYDVPERFLGRFGVRRASLTVAGRNLYTWTGYTGLDPENTFLSGTPGFLEQNRVLLRYRGPRPRDDARAAPGCGGGAFHHGHRRRGPRRRVAHPKPGPARTRAGPALPGQEKRRGGRRAGRARRLCLPDGRVRHHEPPLQPRIRGEQRLPLLHHRAGVARHPHRRRTGSAHESGCHGAASGGRHKPLGPDEVQVAQ